MSIEYKGCNPPDVPKQGPFGHLMQHFESIRPLTDDSVTRLNKLHDYVAARRTLFLSHRHHEAGSLVREVAGHLRDHALCWWDVQELPQSRRYYERCSNKYCGGCKNKIRLLKSVLEGLRNTIWR